MKRENGDDLVERLLAARDGAGGANYDALVLALMMETRKDVKTLLTTVAVLEDRAARRATIWASVVASIAAGMMQLAFRLWR
jgi:hypothetical protein